MTWRLVAVGAAILAAVTGLGAVVTATPSPASPAAISAPVRVAEPALLAIPKLGVESNLLSLGRDPKVDAPAVPDVKREYDRAAWFNETARPGEPGAAVIVGHVDGAGHKGVFYDLKKLRAGDDVLVGRADGSTVAFRVTQVETVHKTDWATVIKRVYGPVTGSELRLVTCGGAWDKKAQSYDSNVVVFAHIK